MAGLSVFGMSRFAVDPESLMRLAASVRSAANEAEAVTGHHSLAHAIAGLRDPSLVGALNDFLQKWSHALRSLLDDAHRIADGAELVARLYDDAENAAQSALPIPGGTP
jgi:hypothetical protein